MRILKLAQINNWPTKNGLLVLYRGEYTGNKNGRYFTSTMDWARQFTQSGLEKEVITKYIHPNDVFVDNPLPQAVNDEELLASTKKAKKLGKKAYLIDEGNGEPNSIYVLDRTALL